MTMKKYELSERHQRALNLCFRSTGLGDSSATKKAIHRLEGIAAKCAHRIRKEPTLAIRLLSWVEERATLAGTLYWDLHDDRTEPLLRIFRKGIGLRNGRSKQFKQTGDRIINSAVVSLEPIALGGEIATDLALELLWNGNSRGDRAVRQFARSVAEEWQATTNGVLPMPLTKPIERDCWQVDAGPYNPLWILLDAVGVNVQQAVAAYLCSLALGKELRDVQVYQGKYRL